MGTDFLSEKISINKPKENAYNSKYHLGVLNGIIIISIKYKNGFIYEANRTSLRIYTWTSKNNGNCRIYLISLFIF